MSFFKSLFGGKKQKEKSEKSCSPEHLLSHLQSKADVALSQKNYSEAVQYLREALEIKESVNLRESLADAYLYANRLPECFEHLQKIAEQKSDDAVLYLKMAEVAWFMNNFGAVADACERALLLDDKQVKIPFLYAKACWEQGDSTNAVAFLLRCKTIEPQFFIAIYTLANFLFELKSYEEVHELLELMPEKEGLSLEVLHLKAKLACAEKDLNTALKLYNLLLQMYPLFALAWKERAEIKIALNDKEEEKEDVLQYEKYLELDYKNGNTQASKTNVEQLKYQLYHLTLSNITSDDEIK